MDAGYLMKYGPLARKVHRHEAAGVPPRFRRTLIRCLNSQVLCVWHEDYDRCSDSDFGLDCDGPIRSKLSELAAFRRMNYSRWKLIQALKRLDDIPLIRPLAREIVQRATDADTVRTRLLETHVGLAKSAMQTLNIPLRSEDAFQTAQLALPDAVDRFNAHYGWRFTTYCVEAMRHKLLEYRERSRRDLAMGWVPFDPKTNHDRGMTDADPFATEQVRGAIRRNLAGLTDIEMSVVCLRFGIGGGVPKTLDELGATFGKSKERMRQIESKAYDKLRRVISLNGH